MDVLYKLSGGATRSEKAPRYDLVPREGIRRIANRFELGAEKHGAGNWMLSLQNETDARQFCIEAYNHLLEHAQKMAGGENPEDDHLGAIGWAVTVLSFCEKTFQKKWTSIGIDEEVIG